MQPRGAATCNMARAFSFPGFDKFSGLAGQRPIYENLYVFHRWILKAH